MSQKIFENDLVAMSENKRTLVSKKLTYIKI